MGQGRVGHIEGAGQIDIHILVPDRGVGIGNQLFGLEHAGIVDQDIDTAERVMGLFDEICNLAEVGDIASRGDGPTAGGLDLI